MPDYFTLTKRKRLDSSVQRYLFSLFALLTLCTLLAASADAAVANPRAISPRGAFDAEEQVSMDLFEKSRDSVVFITTSTQMQDFWSRNTFSVPRGSGSGFLWDEDGLAG